MTSHTACRFCLAPLSFTVVDLGDMPLANAYLEEWQLDREEPRYPLHARLCDRCCLVQVDSVVPPEVLFSDYAYFSSVSTTWVEHAKRFALGAIEQLALNADSLIMEIASNDGYLLRHFQAAKLQVLGIEPAHNVAAVAIKAGVPTEIGFFGTELANSLVKDGYRADLLVANNVLAHVPDLNDFVAGLAIVLAPAGTLSIEVPHLLRLIQLVQFDTIYHEHFSYFSLDTAERVLSAHGLTIYDAEELPSHGGSLRLWAKHASPNVGPPTARLCNIREAEDAAGLRNRNCYSRFADAVGQCTQSLTDFLLWCSDEDRMIVAYGAAAKGNTLLNSCRVSTGDLAYVVDRSPHKQGKYLPGSRLPIVAPEKILFDEPDYVLILPWNLRSEIMEQMSEIHTWGGHFVVVHPQIAIL